MILWKGVRGFRLSQMNSMFLRTPWGAVRCPKTRFVFSMISKELPDLGEIGAGPWSLPVALPTSLGGCKKLSKKRWAIGVGHSNM